VVSYGSLLAAPNIYGAVWRRIQCSQQRIVLSPEIGIGHQCDKPDWHDASRAQVWPPRVRMNITAQSVRPNTRLNVSSSVPLGWGELPGCVCMKSRKNCSGLRPRSTWASKNSAVDRSSNSAADQAKCSDSTTETPQRVAAPRFANRGSRNHTIDWSGDSLNDVSAVSSATNLAGWWLLE
jgi:hypothetical protein